MWDNPKTIIRIYIERRKFGPGIFHNNTCQEGVPILELEKNRQKRLICDIGKRMYARKYVSGFDGNLSTRLSSGHIIISPTGVSKGELEPEMLVEIGSGGNILDSPHDLSPTSELAMHLAIYSTRPDVSGIIHAHPIHATALSLLRFDLATPVIPESMFSFGKIGVADFAIPTTEAVVNAVRPLLTEHDAIILKKHGSLTLGENIMESYYRLESLEHTCEIMYKTSCIGKALPLGHDIVSKISKLKQKK